MDIIWNGQSCFKLKGKTTSIIIDPFDPEMMGFKLPKDMTADVVLVTHNHGDHNNSQAVVGEPLIINGPGEYEVKGVSITGISAFHDTKKGEERGKNTIYHIHMEGLNIVHVGDLGHTLTEEQVEDIGNTDILLLPVGGVFTIDSKTATEVVSSLEPKIIVPMHYKIDGIKFDLEPVGNFLKEMGKEDVAVQPKLTITKDKLPEEPQIVVLSKQ